VSGFVPALLCHNYVGNREDKRTEGWRGSLMLKIVGAIASEGPPAGGPLRTLDARDFSSRFLSCYLTVWTWGSCAAQSAQSLPRHGLGPRYRLQP
jgi:hypothetical protein